MAVRAIAARAHAHPDGAERRYGRSTIDRWIRDWRAGGLGALRPGRARTAGWCEPAPSCSKRRWPCAWSCPPLGGPDRRDPLGPHRVRVSPRTLRDQLRRRGLHREALAAEPKVFGRYEAARPNERWITDVLVDPWVPFPRTPTSVRARLFVIVDDHSRLLVHGRFHAVENTRAGQETLRAAIVRRGLPEVLYADQGAPFDNHILARTCAVLGIRLVHSQPYSPEGRGKQERLNRYIRERFIAEAEHAGIEDLAELNDVSRRGLSRSPTGDPRRDQPHPDGPLRGGRAPRAADPARLKEAFLWVATRRITKTATVSLEANQYAVDPALVGRRVELRYDPADLSVIEVFCQGRAAGVATPFTSAATPTAGPPGAPPPAPSTGVDYLGLVAAAHDAEVVGSISFAQAPLFDLDAEERA